MTRSLPSEGTGPRLDLFEYFEGQTRAWGVFQSRGGDVKRQFTVDIHGTVEGDLLTLEEDFVYADGETSRRVWRIRRLDEHRYEGEAADVIGKASGLSFGQGAKPTIAVFRSSASIESNKS